MTAYVMQIQNDQSRNDIGNSHPKLGASYHESACAFIKQFPIGTMMTVQDFDAWVIEHGMAAPPTSTEKNSEGWLAFLQRRFQAKTNLNKAGAHERMTHAGLSPFCIYQLGQGRLEIRKPFDAVMSGRMAQEVNTLVNTKYRRVKQLIQSIDLQELPPANQVMVMNLATNIEDFKNRVNYETDQLNTKYQRLRDDLRRLVMIGAVQTKNGGIKALTEESGEEDTDEDES